MQANATTGLFRRGASGGRTVGLGLLGEAAAAELIAQTSLANISLLPANIHLAKQSEEFYRQEGYEQRLKQLLAPVAASFDFVIIDCLDLRDTSRRLRSPRPCHWPAPWRPGMTVPVFSFRLVYSKLVGK
jgi:cellulose biosynthesis protein BcsQ